MPPRPSFACGAGSCVGYGTRRRGDSRCSRRLYRRSRSWCGVASAHSLDRLCPAQARRFLHDAHARRQRSAQQTPTNETSCTTTVWTDPHTPVALLLSTSLHPRPSICLRSRAVGCTAWHPTSGWRVPTSHRRITCTHTSPLLSHRSTSLGSRNMAARKRTINTGRTFILRERELLTFPFIEGRVGGQCWLTTACRPVLPHRYGIGPSPRSAVYTRESRY